MVKAVDMMAIRAMSSSVDVALSPCSKTPVNIRSLDMNPTVGGTPAMLRQPMMNVIADKGIRAARPPRDLMSRKLVWCIIAPTVKKRAAFPYPWLM